MKSSFCWPSPAASMLDLCQLLRLGCLFFLLPPRSKRLSCRSTVCSGRSSCLFQGVRLLLATASSWLSLISSDLSSPAGCAPLPDPHRSRRSPAFLSSSSGNVHPQRYSAPGTASGCLFLPAPALLSFPEQFPLYTLDSV